MWREEPGLGAVRQDWSEVLASEENGISSSAETLKPEAARERHNKRRNTNLSCTHSLAPRALFFPPLGSYLPGKTVCPAPWPDLQLAREGGSVFLGP